MNNILSYIQYKEQVRLYESMIINQELEPINEGIKDWFSKRASNKIVEKALAEEIELGKEVEKRIKETMKELSDACDKLNIKNDGGSKFKKSLNKIIDDINKVSFDTLSILGDSDIDFNGFRKSALMANIINISVLFAPIRNIMILRKSYKYFIELIKQTIRKDLVMLMINFDQFQNNILQSSVESQKNVEMQSKIRDAITKVDTMYVGIVSDLFKSKKEKNKILDKLKTALEIEKRKHDMIDKYDPVSSLFSNTYENVYVRSSEMLKSLISEDNQKQVDAYKNSISKISHGDDNLTVYGELMISNAEELAHKTSVAIHTNFLKICEVFKLSNQKKLVELMEDAENEELIRIKKEKESIDAKKLEDESNKKLERGKSLSDDAMKITKVSEFYDRFSDDDISCLRSYYFVDDDGKEKFKRIKKKIKCVIDFDLFYDKFLNLLFDINIKEDKDESLFIMDDDSKKDFKNFLIFENNYYNVIDILENNGIQFDRISKRRIPKILKNISKCIVIRDGKVDELKNVKFDNNDTKIYKSFIRKINNEFDNKKGED